MAFYSNVIIFNGHIASCLKKRCFCSVTVGKAQVKIIKWMMAELQLAASDCHTVIVNIISNRCAFPPMISEMVCYEMYNRLQWTMPILESRSHCKNAPRTLIMQSKYCVHHHSWKYWCINIFLNFNTLRRTAFISSSVSFIQFKLCVNDPDNKAINNKCKNDVLCILKDRLI